jgi:hypothetical protein
MKKELVEQFKNKLGDKVSTLNADFNTISLRGDGTFHRGGKTTISPYEVLQELEVAISFMNDAYHLIYRILAEGHMDENDE